MIARNSLTFRRALLGASALVGFAFMAAGQSQAQTLPSLDNAGGASVSTSGNTMNVNLNGASRVLDFNSFNVAPGYSVTFEDGVPGSTTLTAVNRVLGGTFSSIEGAIVADANVNVWLINSNGVVFGETGSFSGGGLMVSTLDFDQTVDGAFRTAFAAPGAAESTAFTFAGSSSSGVSFLGGSGQINAQGGIVAMGQRIEAGKSMTAANGAITLIAGTDVTLSGGFNDPLSFTINAGTTIGTAQISVSGSLTGQSIVLAGDAQNAVTAALLNVAPAAHLTATASDGRIYIATSSSLPTTNAPGIRSQGTLTATGVNAEVVMEAAGDLTVAGAVTAGRDVSLSSYGELTSAGNVTAGGDYDLEADGDIILGEAGQTLDQAAFGAVSVRSYTGDVIGRGALTLRSNTNGAGSENLSLTSNLGAVDFGLQTSVIGGSGADRSEIIVQSAPTINLGDVSGSSLRTVGSPTSLVATGDIVVGDLDIVGTDLNIASSAGSVTTGELHIAGRVTLDAQAGGIAADSISAAGSVSVTARDDVILGDVASNGSSLIVESAAGDIVIAEATSVNGVELTAAQNIRLVSAETDTGDVVLTATNGDVSGAALGAPETDGRPLSSFGRANLATTGNGRKVIVTAGGTAQLDVVSAGGGLLTPSGPQIDLTAAALDVGVITAVDGDVSVEGLSGNVKIGSIFAYADGGDVTLNSAGTTTLGRVSAQAGDVDLSGDNLVLTGDVRGETVHLVAANGSITQTGGVITTAELTGSATQSASLLSQNAIDVLGDFTAANLSLRDIDGLTIDGDVQIGLTSGALDIRTTGGDLTLASGASVTGQSVLLSTDDAFVNQSGSGAIVLGAGGRWLVYSAAPTGGVFGGLDSGNTAIWNGTADTITPGASSGNRYVFAYQPTVVFMTQSGTKTYGDDLTGSTADFYVVSGIQDGVVGAFLGDTEATAFSGAPTITSAGLAERADVAGGPYAVSIAAGSAAGLNGYAVAVVDSGATVTVTPKGITGLAATADDKIYDGTTAGSGSLSLSGVLSGDDVEATATFTFADKNAGTDKTVSVTDGALNGSDADNYVLMSVPAATMADILRLAITASATANDKTYDGTTAATGALTLNGVLGGDDVTGSADFAFVEKNAGADRTVSVTNGVLAGDDADNYVLTLPATTVADILRLAITASATANDKTYDGTTAATGALTLNGVLGSDDVTASGVFAFADKNAAADKTVSTTAATLGGMDAGNYVLAGLPASTTADIFQRAITVTAQDATKTEGRQDPTLQYAVTDGALAQGDAFTGALAREPGEATGVYAIGQGDLAASGNYQLTFNGARLTIQPADAQVPANPIFESFLISIGNPIAPEVETVTLIVEGVDCDENDCPVLGQ